MINHYLRCFNASSPFIVLICMTPLTPLNPYILDSLIISTDFTSYILIASGLISIPLHRISTGDVQFIEF